jgi:outer membrane protein assembly factor BamB
MTVTWPRQVPVGVVRWTGRVLLAVTVLAVLWPPALEWGGRRWSRPVMVTTVLVVAVAALLWRQAVHLHPRRRIRWVAAGVGAGATVVGVLAAAVVTHAAGLPVAADSVTGAAVLMVVVGVALAYGWALVATVEDGPDTEPAAAPSGPGHGRTGVGVAVATVVVTLAALAVASTIADRTTARPLDGPAAGPPGDLDRPTASFTAAGQVYDAGRYLVVDIAGGVEVRDASTGRPRWHFRDPDKRFSHVLVSGDRRSVVVVRPTSDRPTAVAFDVATGVRRWSRVLPSDRPVDVSSLPLRAAAAGPVIVLFNGDPNTSGSGFAIDARTGDVRWQVPDPPAAGCRYEDSTTAADTVVVAYRCEQPDRTSGWQVVGLSADDGKARWTERGPDGSTMVSVRVTGRDVHLHRFVKGAAACETAVLDAVSGAPRLRYTDPVVGCTPPMVGNGVSAQAWPPNIGSARVIGVDQPTGEVRWATAPLSDRRDAYVLAHLVVGRTAYVLVQPGLGAREADLAAVDLATGAVSTRRLRIPAGVGPIGRVCRLLPGPGRLVMACGTAYRRTEVTIVG